MPHIVFRDSYGNVLRRENAEGEIVAPEGTESVEVLDGPVPATGHPVLIEVYASAGVEADDIASTLRLLVVAKRDNDANTIEAMLNYLTSEVAGGYMFDGAPDGGALIREYEAK